MEARCSRVITDDDLEKFRHQLSRYEMCSLRILYDYFWNDLKHIVEILDTQNLLSELNSRNVPLEPDYLLMEKTLGAPVLSECLIKDIKNMGRDAVLALWESLYVLQNYSQHPNLIAILSEFNQDIHNRHKKNLLEITMNLEEHRAPGLVEPIRSCNISSGYLDLVVVSTHQFRNSSQHEIIETGGRHEHYLRKKYSSMERISSNRLFRWCHRSACIPHAVMMVGVPGVGKTTLMQKFVYDWVNGKHYQRFSFVFFFKFRDLNRYDEISLDKMILEQYPDLHSQLDNILRYPEQLLFIFDGLDESVHNIEFGPQNICFNTKETVNLGVVVVSLVRQSLLKGSSILLTSRPTKLASVDIGIFQRVSEIMGFFPNERKMYFEQFFQDKELSEKAFQYVRENDTLYTFCYIPSYCWIVCTVLFRSKAINNDQQSSFKPKTVTQLFVSYVANILLNHCTDTESPMELMNSIGRMAQHGIMNRILTFDSKDFETFEVDSTSKILSAFVSETYRNPTTTTYSFLHLTLQEFFSALSHFLNYSEKELLSSLERARSFSDGRGEMFLRFLCGLSDGTTISPLRSHLDGKPSASETVIRWLSQEVKERWRPEADPREIMNILTYLFESRNEQLVHSTIGSHGKLDFSECHLTPVDCTILAFILKSCRETDSLNLDRCFIQSEGLERLSGVLHTVTELRLSNNDLKDSDMQIIYKVITPQHSRVKVLRLRNNSLTWASCSALACALSENRGLMELNVSRNNLAGPEFSDLMTTLSCPTCTISCLSLSQIKLTDEYVPYLMSLSSNPNLTHLDLSHNFLTDVSAQHIQDLILSSPNLKEIRIEVNDITKEKEGFLRQLTALKPGLAIIA
ncbi:NACHT, LRR and PYD domains-containing protein 12-like isoform X2 [Hyla sarda]|uniref:NACHT, LRR and PYD domains-containing protein 12-like isoform X2 n=1 Tax=Hyla sarda TaxID=327740 RepID=UPI0024C43A40|nr:NACHT, LRR and PYD domains-containing protein 12-like isoform X2 [Hyla sarda]